MNLHDACRAALYLRGLCRKSRLAGLEASGGFRNGLVGSLGFTDLVFLLDSSKMAQLVRCCSEGRSGVGDTQRLPLSPPREEAVLPTGTSALGNESLAPFYMLLCPIKLKFISAGEGLQKAMII